MMVRRTSVGKLLCFLTHIGWEIFLERTSMDFFANFRNCRRAILDVHRLGNFLRPIFDGLLCQLFKCTLSFLRDCTLRSDFILALEIRFFLPVRIRHLFFGRLCYPHRLEIFPGAILDGLANFRTVPKFLTARLYIEI